MHTVQPDRRTFFSLVTSRGSASPVNELSKSEYKKRDPLSHTLTQKKKEKGRKKKAFRTVHLHAIAAAVDTVRRDQVA
jgi:hypothetical protein